MYDKIHLIWKIVSQILVYIIIHYQHYCTTWTKAQDLWQ